MKSARLNREQIRLRIAFGAALVAAAAPTALAASSCTSQSKDGGVNEGGSDAAPAIDATHSETASSGGDAQPDALDAAACQAVITQLDAKVPDAGPDADLVCNVRLPCGLPPGFSVVGCTVVVNYPDGGANPDGGFGCWIDKDGGCVNGSYRGTTEDKTLLCACDLFSGGGRRPAGLERIRRVAAGSAMGVLLAKMAHDEAASVPAFERLGSELERFGAPEDLVAAAEAAARDEVRHARSMTRAARRYGARPPRPRCKRLTRARTFEAIARENAVEGCVRETYAALLAHFQAANARDANLAKRFAAIAADETRHAALAWAIARWADGRLDCAARARVARARDAAARALARELATEPPPSVVALAGVPRSAAARALLGAMMAHLAGAPA